MLGPIRFLLAAFVVLSHTAGYPHGRWLDPGLPAVLAFFCISGYLLPAAFSSNYSDGNFREQTGRYVTNRLLRVFPLYWAALAITFCLKRHGWELAYCLEHPAAFLQNVFLLGLNQAEFWGRDVRLLGPAWTLDIELQFYLLTPLLVACQRRLPRITTGTVALSSVAGLGLFFQPTGIRGIDYSLLGWWPFFGVGFVAYALGMRLPRSFTQPKQKWLALAGDLSFPLYLLHRPLMEKEVPTKLLELFSLPNNLLTQFIAALLIASAAAVIAHYAIEETVKKWRRRIRECRSVEQPSILPLEFAQQSNAVDNDRRRAA